MEPSLLPDYILDHPDGDNFINDNIDDGNYNHDDNENNDGN